MSACVNPPDTAMTDRPELDLSNAERLFKASESGDLRAFDTLLPLVYAEIRSIAKGLIRGEWATCSLGATELAHEAFLRLAASETAPMVVDARHACNLIALTMRRVLIDRAERGSSVKHGERRRPVEFRDGVPVYTDYRSEELPVLEQALERVAATDPLGVEIAVLRYFCGLKVAEVAGLLGLTEDAVKIRWTEVRVQLRREVERMEGGTPDGARPE